MVEGFLTTAEAARELGLSLTGIHARLRAGIIQGQRVGARGWLIPTSEVERLREMGKLKTGPKPKPRQAHSE